MSHHDWVIRPPTYVSYDRGPLVNMLRVGRLVPSITLGARHKGPELPKLVIAFQALKLIGPAICV